MISMKKKALPRGSLYKHSKTGGWYLRVRWPGETEFSSVPLRPPGAKSATKVKGVAQEVARELIAIRLSHREGVTDTLVELAEQFRSANTLTAKAEHAKKNKAHILRFLDEMEIEQPEAITPMAVRSFLVKLGETLSPKTVREYKTSINLFCTFLVERQLLAHNPCTVVKLRPIKPRPPVLMPTASVEALRERITTSESSYREDLLLAVDIAAHCGLRISEILELRHRALLDQGESFALLVGEKSPTKSGDWRVVPLPMEIVERIRAIRPNAEATDTIFREFAARRTWLKRLRAHVDGIEGFLTRPGTGNLWHALRAFCATQKAKTYPVYRLMYEMGWSDAKVAQRYVTLSQAAGVIG